MKRREFLTAIGCAAAWPRMARAILSQGTAMISTAISMNSAEIGKRDLHIPDLVDQTELDYLKPRREVPETAD